MNINQKYDITKANKDKELEQKPNLFHIPQGSVAAAYETVSKHRHLEKQSISFFPMCWREKARILVW